MKFADYRHLKFAVVFINNALDEIAGMDEPPNAAAMLVINSNLHTVGLYIKEMMDDGWEEEN